MLQRRSFITVVNQAEVCYREFLGVNRVKLDPGLQINIPLLHNLHRVDMRNIGITIKDLNCYTNDNVPVTVSGKLFYRVVDPEKACFSVDNYHRATSDVGQSASRSTIGKFEYDEIVKDRAGVNEALRKTIGDSLEQWGIECKTFEINNFNPQNKHTQESLEKQMAAERSRRENSLNTEAEIRTAEGNKQIEIHRADAEFYKIQKIADSKKYEADKITEALIIRIKEIKTSLPNLTDAEVMTIILEEKKLEHLKSISDNSLEKTTYFVDPKGAFPTINALFNK